LTTASKHIFYEKNKNKNLATRCSASPQLVLIKAIGQDQFHSQQSNLTLQTSRLQFWEEILEGRVAKSYVRKGKGKGKRTKCHIISKPAWISVTPKPVFTIFFNRVWPQWEYGDQQKWIHSIPDIMSWRWILITNKRH
jgi:hypothetical protein